MNNIVIIFPGLGYTAERPLLYYGLNFALEYGYHEYRKLVFSPRDKSNIRGNETAMKAVFDELYAQAEEQLRDVEWNRYDNILFISKSIGTAIAAAYAAELELVNVRQILYTPLKHTFGYKLGEAMAFIGTNDAWSDYRDIVALCEERGIPVKIYEGCNHSLEVENEVSGNIKRLSEIMNATNEFLMKH